MSFKLVATACAAATIGIALTFTGVSAAGPSAMATQAAAPAQDAAPGIDPYLLLTKTCGALGTADAHRASLEVLANLAGPGA